MIESNERKRWIIPPAIDSFKAMPSSAPVSILRRSAQTKQRPLSPDLDQPPSMPRRSRTEEDLRPMMPSRQVSNEEGHLNKSPLAPVKDSVPASRKKLLAATDALSFAENHALHRRCSNQSSISCLSDTTASFNSSYSSVATFASDTDDESDINECDSPVVLRPTIKLTPVAVKRVSPGDTGKKRTIRIAAKNSTMARQVLSLSDAAQISAAIERAMAYADGDDEMVVKPVRKQSPAL